MDETRIYDFTGDCTADDEEAAGEAAAQPQVLDGWRAYADWLDMLRKDLEA